MRRFRWLALGTSVWLLITIIQGVIASIYASRSYFGLAIPWFIVGGALFASTAWARAASPSEEDGKLGRRLGLVAALVLYPVVFQLAELSGAEHPPALLRVIWWITGAGAATMSWSMIWVAAKSVRLASSSRAASASPEPEHEAPVAPSVDRLLGASALAMLGLVVILFAGVWVAAVCTSAGQAGAVCPLSYDVKRDISFWAVPLTIALALWIAGGVTAVRRPPVSRRPPRSRPF